MNEEVENIITHPYCNHKAAALRSHWPPHPTSNPCARHPWVQHLGSPYIASVSLRRSSIIFIQLLKCTVVSPAQNPFHKLLLRLSIVVVCSIMSNSLKPHGLEPARLLCPWDSPGKNTGVGCHALLQGIFPTQESNQGLLHCRQILYQLSYWGRPHPPKGTIKKKKKDKTKMTKP